MTRLLFFFQTDCPTCQLIAPYLNAAAQGGARIIGLSQDDEAATRAFVSATGILFPVDVDRDLRASCQYDPLEVPALVLLDGEERVLQSRAGFDKTSLNAIAAAMGQPPFARDHDGAPASKPGCVSRHRETNIAGARAPRLDLYAAQGEAASRLEVPDDEDLDEYCAREFGDPLPVVPPTAMRVARLLAATAYASAGGRPGLVVVRWSRIRCEGDAHGDTHRSSRRTTAGGRVAGGATAARLRRGRDHAGGQPGVLETRTGSVVERRAHHRGRGPRAR